MLKLGNRKTQRLSCHTLATSVSSASRPTPDIYLCSGGRPEAPHLRPPPRLPSQRRPDRAINSLQRVPPVAFAPLGRGATTEPFTAFGLPAQGSLTLPTANRPSRPPNPPASFGAWRVSPPLQWDWLLWSERGGAGALSQLIGCSGRPAESRASWPEGPGVEPAHSTAPRAAPRSRERPGVLRASATTSGAGAGPWVQPLRQPAWRLPDARGAAWVQPEERSSQRACRRRRQVAEGDPGPEARAGRVPRGPAPPGAAPAAHLRRPPRGVPACGLLAQRASDSELSPLQLWAGETKPRSVWGSWEETAGDVCAVGAPALP